VPRWLSTLGHHRYARVWGAAGLASFAVTLLAGLVLLAYELAAARVPEHRAALERLVRAQTGLDLRFAELSVRWGWYGPEAVFSSVQLGEPASARVLLRAPELIVSFDAWRTVQTGRLQAGRIALIAPDIDLPRYTPDPVARDHPPAAASAGTAGILERWRGGRVDFEGGTLHIADPDGNGEGWALAIRRASLYRANDQWRAQAFVLLPDRLGTSAHFDLRLHGQLSQEASLAGSVHLEGVRLVFAGWRNVLRGYPELLRYLPEAGGGDVSVQAQLADGVIQQANGTVRAGGVEFTDARRAAHPLLVDRVRGDWRVRRAGSAWYASIDGLQLGRSQSDAADSGTVSFDCQGAHLHAQATRLPLETLAALLFWAAPQLDPGSAQIDGTARDVILDWDPSRAPGTRLYAQAHLEEIGVTPASHAFALSGLDARVSGDERSWRVELEAGAAQLKLPEEGGSLTDLRVASRLDVTRSGTLWRVASDEIDIEHGVTRLRMSGSASTPRADRAPVVELRGSLSDADVAQLQALWGPELQARFGAAASHVRSGHIAEAHFVLSAARSWTGSLVLSDARVADDNGLAAANIDARIAWNDGRVRAAVARGEAGPLELGPMQLAWRADGAGPLEVAGRASGRLENTLQWIRDHEQLRQYVPEVRGLAARGDALFDFDMSILTDPAASGAPAPHLARSHVAVALDDATVVTGPGVPSLQGLRGALTFDGGHLRRSLLTGRWLGGPVALRLSERADPRARAFAVKAQGLMDVRQLAALGTVADPTALDGDAEWSGDFLLEPETPSQPAHWQARLDATLTGVASRLPEPLTKAAGVVAPLHIDVAGSSARAELHVALADRLHSVFEIAAAGDDAWRVERGNVRFGGTAAVALTAGHSVILSGALARFDPTPYVAAWNRAEQDDLLLPGVSGAVFVSELLSAGSVYADANLRVHGPGRAPLGLTIEPFAGSGPGT
jgi:uncharacterized protein YhdP